MLYLIIWQSPNLFSCIAMQGMHYAWTAIIIMEAVSAYPCSKYYVWSLDKTNSRAFVVKKETHPATGFWLDCQFIAEYNPRLFIEYNSPREHNEYIEDLLFHLGL